MIWKFEGKKRTFCKLQEVLSLSKCKYLGVDTETKGDFVSGEILCFQIGNEVVQYVIDWAKLRPFEKVLIGKELLSNDKIIKILHNASYDYKFFYKDGIELVNIWDTMLAECLLHAGLNTEKGFYGLKATALRYLGVQMDKEIRGHIHRVGLSDRVLQYAADDVKYLEEIARKQAAKLEEQDLLEVMELENGFIAPKSQFEYHGVYVDLDRWMKVLEATQEALSNSLDQLDEVVLNDDAFAAYVYEYQDLFTQPEKRVGINWRSPLQKLPLLQLVEPEAEDTSRKTLSSIKHPLGKALLDFAKAEKLHSSFSVKIPTYIHQDSKRIHSDFWAILSTGRCASRKPNVQQIPSGGDIGKLMRGSFTAEPGNVLVGGDYSQCELRIIAHYSQDPLWLDVFRKGQDLHTMLAAKTFNIDESLVRKSSELNPAKSWRDIQKTINFGLAYGMSKYKLSSTIGVSLDEAQSIINDFFKIVPDVQKFLNNIEYFGQQNKYILTLDKYKRRRYFDREHDIGAIGRESKNHPIQGCNANILKRACNLLHQEIYKNNYPVKLILMVHDEIISECPIDFAETWKPIMEKLMIQAAEEIIDSIPMKVDVAIGHSWQEIH